MCERPSQVRGGRFDTLAEQSTASATKVPETDASGHVDSSSGPSTFPYGVTVATALVRPPGEYDWLPILGPLRRPFVSAESTPEPTTCHWIYPPPPRAPNVLRASEPVARILIRPRWRHDQVTRSASWSYSECQSCRPSGHFNRSSIVNSRAVLNPPVWHRRQPVRKTRARVG